MAPTFLLLGCQCSELAQSGDQVASLCLQTPQRLSSRTSKENNSAALVRKEMDTIFFGQHTSVRFYEQHFPNLLPDVLNCRYCSSSASRKCTKYCCKQCIESASITLQAIRRHFYFRILRIPMAYHCITAA